MSINQKFLELYKRLETLLDMRYPYADTSVKEYYHALERSMVKDAKERAVCIDMCRTLRNNLSHRNVGHLFNVTDATIAFLENEIDILENPYTAKDVMTPREKIFSVTLNSNTIKVLDEIYKNSYDYVPVLDDKEKVIGVFSLNCLLAKVHNYQENKIEKDSTIFDYYQYIGLDDQIKERFAFVSVDDDVDKIVEVFNNKKDKKVVLLFVTNHGTNKEKIRGIITPHDIIYKAK